MWHDRHQDELARVGRAITPRARRNRAELTAAVAASRERLRAHDQLRAKFDRELEQLPTRDEIDAARDRLRDALRLLRKVRSPSEQLEREAPVRSLSLSR